MTAEESTVDFRRFVIFSIGMALLFSAYIAIRRWPRIELEAIHLFYTVFWVFLAMKFEMPRISRKPGGVGLIVGVLIGITGVADWYAVNLAVRRNPAGVSAKTVAAT